MKNFKKRPFDFKVCFIIPLMMVMIFSTCSGKYDEQPTIEIRAAAIQNGSIVSEWKWGTLHTECIDRRIVTVVNRLNRPVELTSFRTACGCSVINATPTLLKPNNAFTFEFLYDPRGRSEGKNTASGTIDIQDEELREINVVFDVIVNRLAVAQPPRAKFNLPLHSKASETITIVNDNQKDLKIGKIACDVEGVSFDLKEGMTIHDTLTFEVSAVSGVKSEDRYGMLQLFANSNDECPFLSMPIDVNVYDDFDVRPKKLNIVVNDSMQEITRELQMVHFDHQEVVPAYLPDGINITRIEPSQRPLVQNPYKSGLLQIFDIKFNLDLLKDQSEVVLHFSDGKKEAAVPVNIKRLNLSF